MSSVSISKIEFKKAFKNNGFIEPSDSQYSNFLKGLEFSGISSKRELAMFIAQLMHESGGLQKRVETACAGPHGCPNMYDGIVNGRQYFGRGYIQLTWLSNYRAASKDLCPEDPAKLVRNPDLVAEEEWAWKTAFWYWKINVHNAPGVQEGRFGASTNAINGYLECTGPNAAANRNKAEARFSYYKKVLIAFGINERPIEAGCYN